MSNDYDVRYEIRSQHVISNVEADSLVAEIRAAGYLYSEEASKPMTDFEIVDDEQVFTIDGMTALYGEAPEEAHKKINSIIQTKVDPHATVITRWHICTGWEWGEEFGEG